MRTRKVAFWLGALTGGILFSALLVLAHEQSSMGHAGRAVPYSPAMRGQRSMHRPQALSVPPGALGLQAQMMPKHREGGEAEEHGRHREEPEHPEKGADGTMQPGHHRHRSWVAPPAAYANKRSTHWADLAAIARGKKIYQQYCQVCHGADGKGTGPAAKGLAHPPADLTNHFHRPPHDGDAYLFWRVSEGGTVEPFKSMGSAMPAFKTILSEEQRWDVLAYVHAYFHLGLAQWHAHTEKETQEHPEEHD